MYSIQLLLFNRVYWSYLMFMKEIVFLENKKESRVLILDVLYNILKMCYKMKVILFMLFICGIQIQRKKRKKNELLKKNKKEDSK